MDLSLVGKRAVVCGSSQGIGWAAAQELAELGAEVTLLARDAGRLTSALAALSTSRAQVHTRTVADFSDPAQIERAAAEILDRSGTVQILVNNTGGPPAGLAVDATPEQYLAAFTSHL
ncbi:MAG TPA: SDR family NAD(P)-dependent oxidoreductase, partial [Pirellulaceae bacterium]